MKTLLRGGRVWRRDRSFRENCPVVLENGLIRSVGNEEDCDEVLDARGMTVLPGLVDVHTHGRAGGDFTTAGLEKMKEMLADYHRMGVTSVFATLASGTEQEWNDAIRLVQEAGFDGIHLEGCFLNAAKRGAHPTHLLTPLSAEALEGFLSQIQLPCHLTAAFELDADGSFAACARRHGVTMGLGHTMATAAEARLAMERGVTSFSHLYNAMPPLHHREGGAVSVALTSNAWAEVIADGLHICPEMVALAWRCKLPDRMVLITDSMEATGCPDGEYAIAGQKVIVKNGRAETMDGALAGSTLNLWDGVKNLMRFAGIPLEEAIAAATVNPAEMVGIGDRVGAVEAEMRADLLLVDDALERKAVFARGERVL
ncbi:MAG: N-acetylglucosamine-6-phosphate deacetylase [Ruminococcaceae bacterium]|nr:N-acetylglucosamine-6-phosphate deacetylase [Oscillospiraceae bacterium]